MNIATYIFAVLLFIPLLEVGASPNCNPLPTIVENRTSDDSVTKIGKFLEDLNYIHDLSLDKSDNVSSKTSVIESFSQIPSKYAVRLQRTIERYGLKLGEQAELVEFDFLLGNSTVKVHGIRLKTFELNEVPIDSATRNFIEDLNELPQKERVSVVFVDYEEMNAKGAGGLMLYSEPFTENAKGTLILPLPRLSLLTQIKEGFNLRGFYGLKGAMSWLRSVLLSGQANNLQHEWRHLKDFVVDQEAYYADLAKRGFAPDESWMRLLSDLRSGTLDVDSLSKKQQRQIEALINLYLQTMPEFLANEAGAQSYLDALIQAGKFKEVFNPELVSGILGSISQSATVGQAGWLFRSVFQRQQSLGFFKSFYRFFTMDGFKNTIFVIGKAGKGSLMIGATFFVSLNAFGSDPNYFLSESAIMGLGLYSFIAPFTAGYMKMGPYPKMRIDWQMLSLNSREAVRIPNRLLNDGSDSIDLSK